MIDVLIDPIMPRLYTILSTVEEGGEMVTVSVIAWYLHRLTID
jgi:hypothetical protein